MTVFSNASNRKGRYTRRPPEQPLSLTPDRLRLLGFVADFGLLSVPQLVRLSALSAKTVRRHMRVCFDYALVSVIPLSRIALLAPGETPDPSMAFGSASNIYQITAKGLKILGEAGWDGEAEVKRRLSVQNSLFVAHELFVRDVRIWLTNLANGSGDYSLVTWKNGGAAEIGLGRRQPPKVARPDAWFIIMLHGRPLVGLVECDRGTERSLKLRWQEKLSAYAALFEGGHLLKTTGYRNARILAITTSAARRDRLVQFFAAEAPPSIKNRMWAAERSVLDEPDLSGPVWLGPGGGDLRPFIEPLTTVSEADVGELPASEANPDP